MSAPDALEQARAWLATQGVDPPDRPSLPETAPVDDRSDGEAERAASEALARSAGHSGRASDPDEGIKQDADPESVARSIVLRKLSTRAHTRAELERALAAKQVPAPAAEAVLDRMAELGLVNDEAFARDWVESRQQRRHLSRRGLQQELTRKGVARETISSVVQEVGTGDELIAAHALVNKKRAALAGLDPAVRYRRLAGLLSRRGYSSDVVSTVLQQTASGSDD